MKKAYSIRTGAPPPARQIASQVRSAFGFTQGVEGPDGAVIAPLGLRRAAGSPFAVRSRRRLMREALESVTEFPFARRVLEWLFDAAETSAPMPRPGAACREIFGSDNGLFDAALTRLEKRGLIRVLRPKLPPPARELAVRLLPTDEVVATPGAREVAI